MICSSSSHIVHLWSVPDKRDLMELSLYDMVGGDILEPGGHSAHGGRLHGYSAKRFFCVLGPYYTLVKKFG